MKTGKNNKLIAEFMGLEANEQKIIILYQYSWDWLMPVVEKIEAQQTDNGLFEFRIHIEKTLIVSSEDFTTYIESDGGNRFENTYNAVVDFINEHNKNK
tara:strand:+ start:53 stop:349 length:297 start_codon:yes stop_codon:yes gene_type:complete